MKYNPSINLRGKNISSLKKELSEEFIRLALPILNGKKSCNEVVEVHFGTHLGGDMSTLVNDLFQAENDDNWLGSYTPMQSPGTIRLHKERILKLSFFILCENLKEPFFERKLNATDAERIVLITFKTILLHELFHYFCDVMIPFEEHKNLNFIAEEEALAVAFSYVYNKPNLFYGHFRMYGMERHFFNKLVSPGYRDWVKFKELNDFYIGVMEYINLPDIANYGRYCQSEFNDLENPGFMRFHTLLSSVMSSANVKIELV